MVIVILNVIVGVLLAIGAIQEAVVGGLRGGSTFSLAVGTVGTLLSLLLSVSGVVLWRRWRYSRGLVLASCALVAAFCIFAVLPPHRTMGLLAFMVGAGYSIAVILYLSVLGTKGPGIGHGAHSRPNTTMT